MFQCLCILQHYHFYVFVVVTWIAVEDFGLF